MKGNLIPTHVLPGGYADDSYDPDDGMINDSFGTVNFADSTGLDEDKETGDAKFCNLNTYED